MHDSQNQSVSPAEMVGSPKTKGYGPTPPLWFSQPAELPPFTFLTAQVMLYDPMVKLGLAMRLAPLQNLRIAYKPPGNPQWIDGVECDDPRVGQWVVETFQKVWQLGLYKFAQCQVWGWSAAEIVCKYDSWSRLLTVRNVLDRRAEDVLVRVLDGEPVGVRFMKIEHAENNWVDLDFPKCVWFSHFPDPGQFYGRQVLLGCYSPWADKWFNGAALDVRRLFMHKDAYGGADMTYPPGTTSVDGKGDIPNMDIARQIVEQMQSGSVTTRPYEPDDKGNNKWNLTRAQVPANPAHILQYPKDLDVEILRGMEIPDDVLMSGATGAWEGKKVPMMTFLTGIDCWASQMVTSLDQQLLRPMCVMNFGHDRYKIRHMPLVEQFFNDQGNGDPQTQASSPAGGGQGPLVIGDQSPAGAGGAQVQQMANQIFRGMRRAAKRMSIFRMGNSMRAPEGGVIIHGKKYIGGQFIPGEVMDSLDEDEREQLTDAVHGGGRPKPGPDDPTPEEPQEEKGDGTSSGKFTGIGIVQFWDHLFDLNFKNHYTDEELLARVQREFPGRRHFQPVPRLRTWYNAGQYGLGPPQGGQPLQQFVKNTGRPPE